MVAAHEPGTFDEERIINIITRSQQSLRISLTLGNDHIGFVQCCSGNIGHHDLLGDGLLYALCVGVYDTQHILALGGQDDAIQRFATEGLVTGLTEGLQACVLCCSFQLRPVGVICNFLVAQVENMGFGYGGGIVVLVAYANCG